MIMVLTCSKYYFWGSCSLLHKCMSVHQIYSTVNTNEQSVLSADHTLGQLRVRNGFRSEKIPWNRLGTVFVIPWKKVLIPKHSEAYGRVNSDARNGTELHEENLF
jgi:hypothetical protein